MDYEQLAKELFSNMDIISKNKVQKKLDQSSRGGAFVLHFLSRHGDGVLPGDISDEMNISSARIAAVLNSLEDKGLITREIDRSDRRRIIVKMTEAGRETADSHQCEFIKEIAGLLSRLGETDAREYIRITRKIAELSNK